MAKGKSKGRKKGGGEPFARLREAKPKDDPVSYIRGGIDALDSGQERVAGILDNRRERMAGTLNSPYNRGYQSGVEQAVDTLDSMETAARRYLAAERRKAARMKRRLA